MCIQIVDRVLYPNDKMVTTGFCVYNEFEKVVKLTKNERSEGQDTNQKMFCLFSLLIFLLLK